MPKVKSLKEFIEKKREMEELEEKRKKLMAECFEKRSELTADELTNKSLEVEKLTKTIGERQKELNTYELENSQLSMSEANEQEGQYRETLRSNILLSNQVHKNEINKDNYRSSEKYLQAFYRSMSNRKIAEADKEIMSFGKRVITDMNGLSVTSGAEYLVPQTTLNKIQTVLTYWGSAYNAIQKWGFIGDVTLPVGSTGTPTTNPDGTVTLNFSFTEVTINQQAVVAIVKVKNLLMKNSISAFEDFISYEIAKYLGQQLDNYVLSGSISTSKFQGIITQIKAGTEEISYAAGSIDWTKISEILGSLEDPYGSMAKWMMKRQTFFNIFYGLQDANGQPLTAITAGLTAEGKPGAPRYFVGGQEALFQLLMPDTNSFLYGDFKTYYVNESQSIAIDTSDESGFTADETHWRGKVYSGGKNTLPTANTFKYYYQV